MRIVTKIIKVYTFDELEGEAEATARVEIVNALRANGQFRSMVYAVAADWLSNEGWTDLAELRWEDNGPDPDRLQFSIDESETVLRGKGSNRDFVVWSSTRLWTFLATELTIHTQIVGHWEPGMEIKVADAEGIIPQANLDPNVKNGAVLAVRDAEARLLNVLRMAGHDAEADTEYLADYATQQSFEFTADGKLYTE